MSNNKHRIIMGAFTSGLIQGAALGIWSNTIGRFGCFNAFNTNPFLGWSCWSMPSYFVPTFNAGCFMPYSDFMPLMPSYTSVFSPTFNTSFTPTFDNTNFNLQNYSHSIIFGDTFIRESSSPKSSDLVKTNYKYQSTINTSGDNQYNDLILKYAKKYDVDPNLIKAVIKQESRFNPNAESNVGAKGLMQLMPGTATDNGLTVNDKTDDRIDPEKNIEAGVKYLAKQLERFDGDVQLALAGYNAGPGNVKNGKIPENGETPKYVEKVMQYYDEYKSV